jgi:hypothetical protein
MEESEVDKGTLKKFAREKLFEKMCLEEINEDELEKLTQSLF